MMLFLHLLLLATSTKAWDTWCGKHYEQGSPRVPPDPSTRFNHPPTSNEPLLDFRCATASSIYLPDDEVYDPPGVVIDLNVTYDIGQNFDGAIGDKLSIEVYTESTLLPHKIHLPIGQLNTFIPISLTHLEPSIKPHTITCKASINGKTYEATTELWYLPPKPYGGSTVKLDRRTGALWVKDVGKVGWEKIIPFGWYDKIDINENGREIHSSPPISSSPAPFLSRWFAPDTHASIHDQEDPKRTNSERLELAHQLGFNFLHPVPSSTSYAPDGNDKAIKAYFTKAEELGVKVMYDMRHSYDDPSLVAQQVKDHRQHPGLLLWYTADEPDGPSLPLDSTSNALKTIRELDPYHPVALVLNCYDYNFAPYIAGADILFVDVYSIAMNPSYSKRWGTPVDKDYGCSGCDQCQGSFYDLSNRIEEWRERSRSLKRSRTLPMWVVPQAFDDHGEEFWWRPPEGREGAVQIVLAFNHGVMGHCAWIASSATPDLLNNASFIAKHLYQQKRFIVDAAASRRIVGTTYPNDGENNIDVAAWTIRSSSELSSGYETESEWEYEETLIMATQMNYAAAHKWTFQIPSVKGKVKEVLFGDVKTDDNGKPIFDMGRISVAAVIVEYRKKKESLDYQLERGDGVQVALFSPSAV